MSYSPFVIHFINWQYFVVRCSSKWNHLTYVQMYRCWYYRRFYRLYRGNDWKKVSRRDSSAFKLNSVQDHPLRGLISCKLHFKRRRPETDKRENWKLCHVNKLVIGKWRISLTSAEYSVLAASSSPRITPPPISCNFFVFVSSLYIFHWKFRNENCNVYFTAI